ncbi:Ger(x)C family spore germination protein [Paenibacillus sp. 5J-6]|uniref:Ger(X)C family spore germination protein n=1 Tax=Paenibacillus silvestris TaxID=2606219 RepID=A0A6L8UY66_9BACL|nr:Ger(x)C family spore germination protein [Paenibacillus silvestris]MZQ83178.1 Ger(x)C family spore germination protein [Paenibacillus silvestris]
MMKKQISSVLVCLLLSCVLTGCWDRTEINHYAFWMGTFLEKDMDNKVKVSAQIAIPSRIGFSGKQGSGKDRGNIVVSSTGRTLMDTCQTIQDKLPRRLFIGHRRALFIGGELAKEGIEDSLDMYTRNMDTSLRTSAFVVVGKDPEMILKVNSPFDPFSSNAAVDQEKYSKNGDKVLRDFIVAEESETQCPILSVIDTDTIDKEAAEQLFEIKKLAVFNKKEKLVGFLTEKESLITLRLLDRLKQRILTEYISEGKGYITLTETNLSVKMNTSVDQDQVSVHIRLASIGSVEENWTNLDLMSPTSLQMVQDVMQKQLEQAVIESIQKIQKVYKTDVFGFGEAVHRQHPYQWKKIKKDWAQLFPEAKVTVEVVLKIERVGAQGKRT